MAKVEGAANQDAIVAKGGGRQDVTEYGIYLPIVLLSTLIYRTAAIVSNEWLPYRLGPPHTTSGHTIPALKKSTPSEACPLRIKVGKRSLILI